MKRNVERITTLFVFLVLAGCSALNPRQADLFEIGQEAFRNEDWDTAVKSASAILETKPNFLPASLLQGKAMFHLGKYEEALTIHEAITNEVDTKDEPVVAFEAMLYTGRCQVEQGRAILPDTALPTEELSSEKRRASRDFFLSANMSFRRALKVDSEDYEALLWRGYCVFRLENYRKAVELLNDCDQRAPDRWEHRFFLALALEGLYKTNTQSIAAYLKIVEREPATELTPVYEHLTVLHDKVAPEIAEQIFGKVNAFAVAFPHHSQPVENFVARMRDERANKKSLDDLEKTVSRVHSLISRQQHSQAVSVVERYLANPPQGEPIEEPLREAKEEWSLLLEASAEALMAAPEKPNLAVVISSYELARKITNKVERLVVLQQKLNAAQLALSRQETSDKIADTYKLLQTRQYDQVIEKLDGVPLEGLSEKDLDLYHHLRGVASYHLDQWKTAADSFRKISRRDFDDLDLLHGLALLKAGQPSAGVAILSNLPEDSQTEDVHRLLGQHFFAQKDYEQAVKHFSAVEEPRPPESDAHFESRRNLGMALYREGEYADAVTEFELACQILETQLERRSPETYLYLGNAYYRTEDLERAKKVYQDLSNSGLTQVERKKCRDLFLFRGKIYLGQKRLDLAYADLNSYVQLAGQLPDELKAVYGRLVATYGNYMPMDQVAYWNYVSTTTDYNYTLHVNKKDTGAYRVQRREGSEKVTEETWWRQGVYLVREVGESVFKLPINLQPGDTTAPVIEYSSRGMQCTSEIVEIDQTVEIRGKGTFDHCIKVRTRQRSQATSGPVRSTKHIFYFAPGVGEIKQEIYRDDVKVSEIVLSQYANTESTLGN